MGLAKRIAERRYRQGEISKLWTSITPASPRCPLPKLHSNLLS